jgi:hypothetical protein
LILFLVDGRSQELVVKEIVLFVHKFSKGSLVLWPEKPLKKREADILTSSCGTYFASNSKDMKSAPDFSMLPGLTSLLSIRLSSSFPVVPGSLRTSASPESASLG